MPPVLRLSQFQGSRGSQVEEPDRIPVRPAAQPRMPPVLVLRNVQPAKQLPEGFNYHAGTTAVVSETEQFVEVSDGPPGSGLTMGERRSKDGTWTERFVHQVGATGPGGAGQGKGSPKGKGKGTTTQPRDHGRRMGKNSTLGQRYKENWERVQDPESSVVRTKVERHVQEVHDVDAGDEATVHQEWDEDEEVMEMLNGASTSSSSSSSSPAPGAVAQSGGRQVLSSRTWTQKGKDRRSGRTWTRAITRRKVRVKDEVLSESEEETFEVEADGEERGQTRHRLGRSISTKEWGTQPNGNRWRSIYALQTLVNANGEVRGREHVLKWYDNGQEEQTEEWQTLDEFEEVPAPDGDKHLKLKRRIRSGRKDGKKHTGQCTEWHERWEESEVPDKLTLRLERKKVEKWWRENACNNAWGEHQIDHVNADGTVEKQERRKWYDNGQEKQDESWVDNADGTAEGTKEGSRGQHSWGERWKRTSAGDDGMQTVEKWHDDGLGTKVESKEGKRWQGSKDVEWHREELGEVVGQSQTWTVKTGGNVHGDEWFESWSEKQAEKTAEKRGKNAAGDEWREAWVEEYDADGIRIRHQAEKQGSNAKGDAWYEKWIEQQEEQKKTALKYGKNADGAEWQEEWGEQAGADGSGVKWTAKWADDGSGNRWGNSWGDEWGSHGSGGKRWVEDWDNKGKLEKHCHGTNGRPEH